MKAKYTVHEYVNAAGAFRYRVECVAALSDAFVVADDQTNFAMAHGAAASHAWNCGDRDPHIERA